MGWRSHGGSSKGATMTPLTSTHVCCWKLTNPRSQCIAPMLLCSKPLVGGQASMTARLDLRPRHTAPRKTVVSCLYIFQKMNARHTSNTEDRSEQRTIGGPTRRNGLADIGSRKLHGVPWIKNIYTYLCPRSLLLTEVLLHGMMLLLLKEQVIHLLLLLLLQLRRRFLQLWIHLFLHHSVLLWCQLGRIFQCPSLFPASRPCSEVGLVSMFVIIAVMSCLAGCPPGEGVRAAMASSGLLAADGFVSWDECNRWLFALQQSRSSQAWGSLVLKDVV